MKVSLVASTKLTLPRSRGKWPLSESGYIFNPSGATDPDELHEAAGRLCYRSFPRPNPNTADNKDYLANIIKQNHFSVLEHSSVTLHVSGVSRAMLLELERHRFLSFSVVSQRYVDHCEANVVVPPVLRNHPAFVKIVRESATASLEAYRKLSDLLMEVGFGRKEARGAARSVLPEGTETEFFVTGNIRTWREIIQKRYSQAADQEIREFAKSVLDIIRTYAPHSVQDMEP